MKKLTIAIICMIILSFAVSIFLYPDMPERMASHWNAKGEVNGYMPRFWGLFLMPIISVAMLLLFLIIPYIDPMKKNIDAFRPYFDGFILLMMIFLFYIHLLTLFWNLGYKFSLINSMLPAFAILFYYIGILTENAKRNWFIGIRTPWTLSNDKVWQKTHMIGGRLFKISAVIALAGLFFQKYAILFVLVPIIISSIYVVAYSYYVYRKAYYPKEVKELLKKKKPKRKMI
ncbi:hypothetical protein COV19_03165 [Candidatus Woesearchaeota archaeon CG10_big_fil_rev_8_21_14_0_10_44_13]|nr:MAG: hypothetical protein COV19_03165 [Candidatus Woesearchaeota archaeon CG10_big_fil_rev_8_21_14_0_10_44_13]